MRHYAMLQAMDYREVDPPHTLRAIVKLGWTLSVPERGPAWVKHRATPDGCMEIIGRLSGRSRWGEEQPECFVCGISTTPVELELGAGSEFVALRIWPWAWRLIGDVKPVELADRWLPLEEVAPGLRPPAAIERLFEPLVTVTPTPEMERVAEAVPNARTAGELASASGMPPRALQRWFERNVGLAPSTYLRLVRFSEAFAGLEGLDGDLAGHAAQHGFADQAHMAREFRLMAGSPASRARGNATGPFLREDGTTN